MFESLRNSPKSVVYALNETAKLAKKLKAKKTAVATEDCGKCYGCATMRSVCTGDI
tara:strand:- start:594 stop:761 length:168 start_codon:yes stop_codon:yes gene_type:complete